ncbi:hypothetical protein [Yinghuangia soli]|uniref:Uncharacterized protein n=1 Tax=Yinghuangia soli TaxID=2908204 RepID=A0AA41Q5I4_9ACTN|nr:hypothetical protein [Yinghuangia soli]MCF2531963.1 hypothetical protein [Yinghuangia soli]
MHSFLLVQGSNMSGSVLTEYAEVHRSTAAAESGIRDYVRSGGGFELTASAGQELSLRVYQQGVLVAEHDLMQALRLRIPGFAEMGFDDDYEHTGGAPEPDSDADGIDDPDLLADMRVEAMLDHYDEVGVRVEWDTVDIPELNAPLLPDGQSVTVDGWTLTSGPNWRQG